MGLYCEGIMVFMRLTPKGVTDCEPKLPFVLGEDVGGNAKAVIGRLGKNGTLRMEVGRFLWEERAEPIHIGVEAVMVAVLGWGMVCLRPSDARGLVPPHARDPSHGLLGAWYSCPRWPGSYPSEGS